MEFFFENISLGDGRYFEVDNGERVRKQDIQRAQGEIPFYSSSKFEGEVMGYVSNKIKDIVPNAKKFNGKFLTVNADGSVGKVFVREGEFYLNDVVNIIKVLNKKILYEYLLYELQNKIDILGYGSWNKKLYKTELKQEISIEIPVDENGEFDLDKQIEIAEKYRKIEEIKNKLKKDYKKIEEMKIDINSKYETKPVFVTGENGIFEAEKGSAKYTKKYMHDHQGKFPVYSSQTSNLGQIGSIDTFDYDEKCFTWTTDGTYVGTVFYRNGKFSITTHCGILRVKSKYKNKVNFEYIHFILNQTLQNYKLGEGSNKRLGTERMKEVQIEIPVDENGEFDLDKQIEIAEKYRKIEEIKNKLKWNYERIIESKIQVIES
jgi:restriction endonuclease S subunit